MPTLYTMQDFLNHEIQISFSSFESIYHFLAICERSGLHWVSGRLPTQPSFGIVDRLRGGETLICSIGELFLTVPRSRDPNTHLVPYEELYLGLIADSVEDDLRLKYRS